MFGFRCAGLHILYAEQPPWLTHKLLSVWQSVGRAFRDRKLCMHHVVGLKHCICSIRSPVHGSVRLHKQQAGRTVLAQAFGSLIYFQEEVSSTNCFVFRTDTQEVHARCSSPMPGTGHSRPAGNRKPADKWCEVSLDPDAATHKLLLGPYSYKSMTLQHYTSRGSKRGAACRRQLFES